MENHPLIEVINKTTPFEEEDIRLFLSVFEEKNLKRIRFCWKPEKQLMKPFYY